MVDSCAPCDSQQLTWWPRHCTDSFLRQSVLNFVLHPTTLQGSQRVNEWCKEIRIYRLFLTCSYGFCVFRRALSLFHYCSACAHVLSGQLICNQVDFPKMCTSGWLERLDETVWNGFFLPMCLFVCVSVLSQWRGEYLPCYSGSTFPMERGKMSFPFYYDIHFILSFLMFLLFPSS